MQLEIKPLVVPADSGTLKTPLVGWDLSEFWVWSGLFWAWKPTQVPRKEWGFHWPSGKSPVFRTKCVNLCCHRVLFSNNLLRAHHLNQLWIVLTRKKQSSDIIVRFCHKKVNLLTHLVKFRVGNFDVGTTRYPRGKWGFSNKNPTSGPPTVGFPRVVLTLLLTRTQFFYEKNNFRRDFVCWKPTQL